MKRFLYKESDFLAAGGTGSRTNSLDGRSAFMTRYGKNKRKIFFTLTEMLVVVAIIIVIATLLLPTIETALIVANGITCKSNMKSMGLAISEYLGDWDWCFLGIKTDQMGIYFTQDICWAKRLYYSGYHPGKIGDFPTAAPDSDCDPSWDCPEFKRLLGKGDDLISYHSTYYGTQVMMGWNGNGQDEFDKNKPANWFRITSPSERCIVLEVKSDQHGWTNDPYREFQLVKLGWSGAGWSWSMTEMIESLAVDPFYKYDAAIHAGRPNFLYADFHVDKLNRKEFLQAAPLSETTPFGTPPPPMFFPWDAP